MIWYFHAEYTEDGRNDLEPKVIYEDNHIIVVIKPFGMPSQEDDTGDMDMLRWVKEYVRVKYEKKGEAFIGLLHRLDRVAGGVMVFARTSKAASRISEQIRTHSFSKKYFAVIENTPDIPKGVLEDFLIKDKEKNKVSVVNGSVKEAKKASLCYKVIAASKGMSLVDIDLYTGRSHQIRVQFSSRKHPIIGDFKYGSAFPDKKAIALWSYMIELEHPVKKEKMRFTQVPPMEFPWSTFSDKLGSLDL